MFGRASSVGIAALLVAVGLAPAAAHASFPGTSGRIAYISVAHNCPDVHTVAANGTGDSVLTNCPGAISDPAWNAAANRIAVAMTTSSGSNGPGPLDIYTMTPSGTGLVRVTNDSVEDADPNWSPDGSTLVEGRVRNGGPTTLNIATVPSAGGAPTTLVTGSPGNEAGEPQFSPDGTRIAFQQRTGTTDDIYVMGANGTNKVDVTPGTNHNNEYPTWSPDGKYLAFASDRNGVFEIFVIDVSGGASNGTVYPITTETSAADIQPTWSPDQTMIAFTHGCADDNCSGQSGMENGDIDAVNVSDLAHPGSRQAIVATSLPEFGPDWGKTCSSGCNSAGTDVKRNLTLTLSGSLTAKGELADPTGKHPQCAVNKTVKVQKRASGSWHTLATVKTSSSGGYKASIPNRSGTYRALAPAVDVTTLSCLKAVSPTRTRTLKHARTIPYFNLAAKPDGSAMFANGQLKAGHFDPCASPVPVKIQKRSGSTWTTIATTRSKSAGTHGLANFGVNIPIRNGDYRALAPKIKLSSGDVCGTASATTPWPPSG